MLVRSLIAVLLLSAAPAAAQTADLVLRNGKVVTVDPKQPYAQAIAVAGDRILAVGSDADIARHIGPTTKVVDLAGRLTIPGLIEGHGHFMGLGQSKQVLDLTKATSWDDIVSMVGAAAKKAAPGEWILGRGWHQEKWKQVPEPSVDGVPVHATLSAVSPNNPVVLVHASGHASFANAKALEVAKVTRTTKAPEGGDIVKDAAGNPTGLLRETAAGLVGAALAAEQAQRTPAQREAEQRERVRLAGAEAWAHGITSFHDAGISFSDANFYKRLAEERALPVRIYAMIRSGNPMLERRMPESRLVGHGDGFLTVRAIKHSIDGALGPHGAWLLEPYADLPTSTGNNTTDTAVIRRTAELALQHGWQLNTHAIGDRANRETLDIYASAMKAQPERQDLRWRIEHAQHVHPSDVPRFKELGLIASMQGIHATSDGPWVLKRLGEVRAETESYLWRSFLDQGTVVTNGTDVPVEPIDPISSFYASVTRRMSNGEAFYPQHAMTREEALHSYTLANAYAAFEEAIKGSITPGKLADIVVLSQDILTVPEERIRDARVDLTILGGKVVYDRRER